MRSALYISICLSLLGCSTARQFARNEASSKPNSTPVAANINSDETVVNAPQSIAPPRDSLIANVTTQKLVSEAEVHVETQESVSETPEILTTSGELPEPGEPLPFPSETNVIEVADAEDVERLDDTVSESVDGPNPVANGELLIPAEPEIMIPPQHFDEQFADGSLALEEVIRSVYNSFPKLEAALFQRNVAQGQQLSANGSWDLKVKGASENGPLGFYETYRQSLGFIQPTYGGGEVFGGYRIGRGDFEPWYQERNTNDGGEFKVGALVPLAQNRSIDARRANLWKSNLEVQLTEPDIQAQLIGFVQAGSYAYWDWVAAGQKAKIAADILALAENRTGRIRRQVELELIDPPELTDNLRLVAERKAKLADAERKFRQKAAKLSLYYRDNFGRPVVPATDQVPTFPPAMEVFEDQLESDIAIALRSRPEIQVMDFQRRQYEIDYSQASNGLLPELDAVVQGKQDVGAPTSKKRDKSQFELEASVFLEVPLQRRKARGKMQAVQGKLAQLSAKRRYAEDQIVVDVQQAFAALIGAYTQTQEIGQAVEFAKELARREQTNFDEGASDLLKVTLREQYAVESANKQVEAMLLYYLAQADYRAALALDRQP